MLSFSYLYSTTIHLTFNNAYSNHFRQWVSVHGMARHFLFVFSLFIDLNNLSSGIYIKIVAIITIHITHCSWISYVAIITIHITHYSWISYLHSGINTNDVNKLLFTIGWFYSLKVLHAIVNHTSYYFVWNKIRYVVYFPFTN